MIIALYNFISSTLYIILSHLSPFLTISFFDHLISGQYFSHQVVSIMCHVFSQLVFLHVSLYVVPPSLFRSASDPSH